jgi:hypothetical protein
MRRIIIVALGVALAATAVWAVRAASAGSTRTPAASATASATAAHQHAAAGDGADHAADRLAAASMHPMAAYGEAASQTLASQLARARLATASYATSLRAAKAAGYQIITRMIPDMGYHFLNPNIQGFDVTKPAILVYEHHGNTWQLGALEWVFTATPATPPLPGATYGSFAAACHYLDGTFVAATSQQACAKRSPSTGARFNFWHPDLVTLHVWLWYPNDAGLYNGTNPYVEPFNGG